MLGNTLLTVLTLMEEYEALCVAVLAYDQLLQNLIDFVQKIEIMELQELYTTCIIQLIKHTSFDIQKLFLGSGDSCVFRFTKQIELLDIFMEKAVMLLEPEDDQNKILLLIQIQQQFNRRKLLDLLFEDSCINLSENIPINDVTNLFELIHKKWEV